ILRIPMDLSTVEHRLNSSNPEIPRYASADEFVADVHLIFSNCYFQNDDLRGGNAVSYMGGGLEAVFEVQLKAAQNVML
ncbi:hypothetical protein B0H19DRAFT_926065, partial [Mycena capillaripes]